MADTCPKCGFAILESDKCPQCGVMVPLYRSALEKFRRGNVNVPLSPAPPSAPPSAVGAGTAATRRLTFHGRGGTLFGIHIVNVCLTLATLGVYSFWGKVRVRRYLIGQSAFERDRFAYHGTGPELFRGFLKAVLVFFLPVALVQIGAVLSRDEWVMVASRIVTSIAFFAFVPVAVVGARRYRLSRTSWRGIRFSFDGRAKEYARFFVRSSMLTPLTLGLYYPIFHARNHAFMVSHSHFGQRAFQFDGRPRDTFRPFLLCALLVLPTLGLSWIWLLAWRRRYYWEHTAFDAARFCCTVTAARLLGLYLVNAVLLIVTLGFAWPWVRARNARFAFDNLVLQGTIDLAAIVPTASTASATGDAVSSFLGTGFDLG
jgi:uncharacterized membrane protein YjgN (DUF898 family)